MSIAMIAPGPVHTERTLASSPPPYSSPTRRSPSPAPAPIELRLDTAPSPPRSNRSSWAATESDITSAAHSGVLSANAGLVHIPLNSPAPQSAAGHVIKSPAQRLKSDPIAVLLYLRKAVTVTTAEKEKNTRRARRHSSASSASEGSTVVGEEDEKTKERDLAEPWSAAPTASYREKLPAELRRDIEAQKSAEKLARRRPMLIALVTLLVLLAIAGTALGVYLGVRNGFH